MPNSNALFGVAYVWEQLKSHPSIGQLMGNLAIKPSRLQPAAARPAPEDES